MGRAAASLTCGLLLLAGCTTEQPQARPTIGSPSPTPSSSQTTDSDNRASQLAKTWELSGSDLPPDWPDVPLPKGTEVVTAYAIGAQPRRTWTATFTGESGTALDMAQPVIDELTERGYIPIAEYVGAAQTNTGLFSFAAPTFAVYVVLGDDDGQPNLVLTVRGSTDDAAGAPDLDDPIAPIPGTTPTASASAS